MAFLPWQQVSAPNNSTAASFMRLAMQGVESAGKSFSDAAQGAAGIQKNKADLAREKATALLSGQVLNAPDSEAASKLMQDALTASGDSGLFNTQSLQEAQDVRKTRIDTETAEVDLNFRERTLDDRVTQQSQLVDLGAQNIERGEHELANTAVTDVVNAMESPIRTYYLDTGHLPSTEEMGSMLNEYFKSHNIDPNSERGQLIQSKFASQVQTKAMAVALEVDGKLTPVKAASDAADIAAGNPNLGSTATVDVLNRTGSTAQVASDAVTRMTALGKTADGKEWDTKTTGAASPQEWESKLLMLAGKHDVPAGQLQMALSMGFRNVDDENGFLNAVAGAQQQYERNKEYETTQNNLDTQLAKVTQDIQRKELSLNMLTAQEGNLTPKQLADKKAEIDTLKEAQRKLQVSQREAELGKWVDPYKVEVALNDLQGKGGFRSTRPTSDSGKQVVSVPHPLAHTGKSGYQVIPLESRFDSFASSSLLSPNQSMDITMDYISKAVKGEELLTDSKTLDRWREGKIVPGDVAAFQTQLSNSPELTEEFTNWYNNNTVRAREGDREATAIMTASKNSVVKSFMKHHAIVSEVGDSIRETQLAELNMDNIANELTQKALAGRGMTPVEPVQLTGSRGSNTSNRNPDPTGSTTIQLRAGEKLESSIRPVVNDFFQERFGRPLTAPEWQAVMQPLIGSVADNKTLDDTIDREIEISNELLEFLFTRQS